MGLEIARYLIILSLSAIYPCRWSSACASDGHNLIQLNLIVCWINHSRWYLSLWELTIYTNYDIGTSEFFNSSFVLRNSSLPLIWRMRINGPGLSCGNFDPDHVSGPRFFFWVLGASSVVDINENTSITVCPTHTTHATTTQQFTGKFQSQDVAQRPDRLWLQRLWNWSTQIQI